MSTEALPILTCVAPNTILRRNKLSAILVQVNQNSSTFTLVTLRQQIRQKFTSVETSQLFNYIKLVHPINLIMLDDRALPDFQGGWVEGIEHIVVHKVMNQARLVNFLTPARCKIIRVYSYCPIEVNKITSTIKDAFFEEFIIKGQNNSCMPAVLVKYSLCFLAIKCVNTRIVEIRNDRSNAVSMKDLVYFVKRTHCAPTAHFHIENVAGTRAQLEEAFSKIRTDTRAYIGSVYNHAWKSQSYIFTLDLNVTIARTSDEYEDGVTKL